MKSQIILISFFSIISSIFKSEKSHSTIDLNTQFFQVTLVPPENGSYEIEPKLPVDGQVQEGTRLAISARPNTGYRLDAIYYTVAGGMWGTTHYEYFSDKMQITVSKDMHLGANFIDAALVENIEVTHDVIYAQPGVKPLKYDVFAPKGARLLPCVIIIHGGGWSSNNEDIMRGLARELTRGNQLVVFSIDYRWIKNLDGDLEPNYMHHLIEDVFGAIAHIQEYAEEYGADPTRIAITGDSAGGHLSAAAVMLCSSIGTGGFGEKKGVYEYLPSYLPANKSLMQVRIEITQAIKSVAPSYSPFTSSDFSIFVEQEEEAYHKAISPLYHVPLASDRSIPHFIVRGTQDQLIPPGVVEPYIGVLKEAGQTVEYLEVEGASHAFFDWKPDAQTRETFLKIGVPYAAKMKTFFLKHFE